MRRSTFIVVIGVLLAAPTAGGESPLAVGVLTPGWHPETVFVAGRGFSPQLLDAVGFGAARRSANRREETALNETLAAQRFDLRTTLQGAVLDALRTRGLETHSIPVVRQGTGRGVTLRRDEIPANVAAAVLLDLHIRYAFVAQTDDEKHWRPGVVVSYLWITADGRPIGLRKVAVFNRDIQRWGRSADSVTIGGPRPYVEDVAPAPGCEFETIEEAETHVATLRSCFESGIDELAKAIAATVPAR